MVYVAVDGQNHITNQTDEKSCMNIEETVNNAQYEKSNGAIAIENNGDLPQRNNIISMPTVEIWLDSSNNSDHSK